ncbi:MAG: hypothetical protein PVG07_12220 [Acidobacteriota bacterium]
MDLYKAEWRLAVLWLVATGVVLLVLVGQSYFGLYVDHVQDAWAWFLPTVMPTLSLIIGVLVAEGLRESREARRLDPRLFHLATALSALYLLLVLVSVLAAGLLAHRTPSIELLQRSNLWLGPVQGLVAASLGVVFRRSEPAAAA